MTVSEKVGSRSERFATRNLPRAGRVVDVPGSLDESALRTHVPASAPLGINNPAANIKIAVCPAHMTVRIYQCLRAKTRGFRGCALRRRRGRCRAMATKRICRDALEAVEDVRDGASILVQSFGPPQAWPTDLLLALRERRVRDLTIICNSPAGGPTSLQILGELHQIRKLICTYAILPITPTPIADQIRAGEIALELVPQGTMAERVRAGGGGLSGSSTTTGAAPALAERQEERVFVGTRSILEQALGTGYTFLQAHQADAVGNRTYRRGGRNVGPAFATAATTTIAEVNEIVPVGALDPEAVVTPGIFVDRIVQTTQHFD